MLLHGQILEGLEHGCGLAVILGHLPETIFLVPVYSMSEQLRDGFFVRLFVVPVHCGIPALVQHVQRRSREAVQDIGVGAKAKEQRKQAELAMTGCPQQRRLCVLRQRVGCCTFTVFFLFGFVF
eukprot:TRINITY_DN3734_c0_g1_i1.p1 TRINITY_DN3734_c0_g1~~TRINITY_DN3734_c0_g1_i1.p1  ORF type:complete len:124 (+),score=11.70 TRINITY_DN3734_c0_g1_i1:414-785(+)